MSASIDNSVIVKIYRRIGLLTCSSVFLLFLLGSLVRATGSGMGCPDWPMCFGQLAPPFSASELPADYEQIFLKKRVKKLERFTSTLEKIGLKEKAEQIRNEKSLYEPEAFHPVKAWIEYINRLFGALSGLFAVAFFGIAIWWFKIFGRARIWMLLGFVFLILNAWLGSLVVATNLLPGMVSLHFVLAFLCLFAFIKALHVIQPVIPTFTVRNAGTIKWVWIILFVEVILGTWSREQVDALKAFGGLVSKDMGIPIGGMSVYPEILNVMGMDGLFAIHRYLPVLILLYTGYQYIQSRRFDDNHIPWQWLSLFAFTQIGLGVLHIWLVVPAWVQVGHVLLGSAILTYSFLLMLSVNKTNEKYI